MLQNDLTLLIHSCDKYSDLWDAHVELLNHNWPDRSIDTFLVSDLPSDKKYKNVTIISAGEGKEITDRTAAAIPLIQTEFVLVTLDDYFVVNKIDSTKIEQLIIVMKEQKLDYLRLFPLPNSSIKKINGYSDIYSININDHKSSYYVNLYPGIWKKSFIQKTIRTSLNAWQYEVSLTPLARKLNVKCAMSKGKEFEILDVIRKGKVLHKANHYFKKNPVYHGNRELISWKEEIKINYRTVLKRILPRKLMQAIKIIMIKQGKTFYSDLD